MAITKIGERISTLRKKVGWSQAKLAELAGVSRAMIGRYERGTDGLSLEVATQLAQAFGVTLDYLAGNLTHSHFSPKTLRLMDAIEGLPSDDREKLFWVVEAVVRDVKAKLNYT